MIAYDIVDIVSAQIEFEQRVQTVQVFNSFDFVCCYVQDP